jgi:transporter family protein
MQMRAEVVGLAAATIVAWGTWGVFSKLAVERIDQQVLVWGSLITVPVVFFVYLVATSQLVPLKMDGPGVAFAALGGVGAALGTVCFYLLLARERVSLTVPVTSLYPAVTVMLSVLFLREHLSGAHVLGILFALAAVVLLSR